MKGERIRSEGDPTYEAVFDAQRLVTAERLRQIGEENWTPEHDDEHDEGELSGAAACYAQGSDLLWAGPYGGKYLVWPWDPEYWKPTPDDRVRELVKAGALILAEIERLQRAKAKTP